MSEQIKLDEIFMSRAIDLAQRAFENDEIPVGAIITNGNKIIGEGYNKSISKTDCTAHAEIEAIRSACQKLDNYRLTNCNIYVTLEPCSMCAGALIHARIKKIHFSTLEPKAGAIKSNLKLLDQDFLNHKVDYSFGLLEKRSSELIRNFFKKKRKK